MSKPLLCETVTGRTLAELRRRRDEVRDADLVELRLDHVVDPDPAGALAGRRHPVIVTCRSAQEGGAFNGSEEERKRLLRESLALGAEWVDIEARARFDDLVTTERGRRIVLSMHDFSGVPSDLAARLDAMCATGAEVVKVAVTARTLADCAALLTLSRRMPASQGRVIIGMGESGLATRALAARFGSRWTYAGNQVAPGQLPAERLLADLDFRRIGPETALYGLVGGSRVVHSLSPAMHNAAFRQAGIDAVYVPLAAASADDFVRFAEAFGVRGASVTIPYKTAIFERIAELDEIARRVGAVNTIRRDDDRWAGTNTDVHGFLAPLRELGNLRNSRAAILGAGGAARAVAVALASEGARVSVFARDPARARPVAAIGGGEAGTWPPPPGTWDLLVNATPVGMSPDADATPLPGYRFVPGTTVYDLIYNPTDTRLLREAAAAGCRTIGGLAMLAAQAERQFEWWTGRRAPAHLFGEAAAGRLRDMAVPR
jgi:3-dehydroquinate dehydratase/shikimate dehydrogenase